MHGSNLYPQYRKGNLVYETDSNIFSVDSVHVLIITGERKYLELKVMVDSDVAPLLTVGREKIEDILVLHLEGGKDFFVSLLRFLKME